MKISAIIIEDELDAQMLLTNIIKDYCPNIALKGVASDIESGVELIKSISPQLVFLDINLGEDCGFSVLDQFLLRPFKVIITTAYEEYALTAFKYEVVDYILKPYSPIQVRTSIERVYKLMDNNDVYHKIESLLDESRQVTKISLPTHDSINIFKINEIVRLEADRAYCCLFLDGGIKTIISKSLKEIQASLPNHFFRTHTSHLINIDKLVKYSKEDGGFALMSDGSKIPIARRRKTEFLELIQSDRMS